MEKRLEQIEEILREAGAETSNDMVEALEDGELLARLGIADTEAVEALHDKMKNTTITALTAAVDTENGFAYIVTSDDLTIQCCLEERADGMGYKKMIDASDCGESTGICGDENEKAFEKYGKEESMIVLFSEVRKIGVTVKK